ncbi:MAG: hypothetical protein JWM78_1901 [Verrucomicrobiaceae bacterium]|nr:hypothetical protein [Verrucomicrobiaceae bacterium]
MKHLDSEDTTFDDIDGIRADSMRVDSSDAPTARPSAIERQIAASRGDYGSPPQRETMDRPSGRSKTSLSSKRRRHLPFGLISFLVLVLIVTTGVAFVFTTKSGRALPNGLSTVLTWVEQKVAAPAIPNTSTSTPPAVAALPVAPQEVPATESPAAVSVPIADISLSDRPELLEQLVQVYRSKLAANPTDAAALAALNRLQEQSLSQLETIMAGEPDPASFRALGIVSRLFPWLADNPRYKSLLARSGQIQREAQREPQGEEPSTAPVTQQPLAGESLAKAPVIESPPAALASPQQQSQPQPQPATPSPTAIAAPPVATQPVTNLSSPVAALPRAASIPPQAVVSSPRTVSLPANAAAEIAKKPAAPAAPPKPQIRVASVTPGTMIDQRFVASNPGKAFLVEINYRDFKSADDDAEVALVALIGTPGDPSALAEVPVDISGDRGTKSFVMETLIPGNTGETYRLNFMLNGEFLTSATVRLSAPKQ